MVPTGHAHVRLPDSPQGFVKTGEWRPKSRLSFVEPKSELVFQFTHHLHLLHGVPI